MIIENIKRMFNGKPLLATEPETRQAVEKITITALDGMKASSDREDAPKWRRSYSGPLVNGITCTIEAKSHFRWSRSYIGELRQPNGRIVIFFPESIADKIIDPVLVSHVERFCRDAIAWDKQFMASSLDSFVDENGQKWVKG